MKITQGPPFFAVHVESPLVIGPALQQDCPGALFGDLQVMFGCGLGLPGPECPGLDLSTVIYVRVIRICGHHVMVCALDYDGDQITRMVMKVPVVVRSQPVVDPDGIVEEEKGPAVQVRTFRTSK